MRRDSTSVGRAGDAGSRRSRAQTAQDFAVGIGLFLLAVAFVFATVPQLIQPYEAGLGATESAQTDRAAASIVGNLSVDDRPNELDSDATETYFQEVDTDVNELRNRTGLPFSARINVSVRNLENESIVNASGSSPTWAGGSTFREGREVAATTRIVRTTGPECEPGCELVVRVW